MKKVLFFSVAFFATTTMFGQRIAEIAFNGVKTLGWGASANPKESAPEATIGVAFVIVEPNTNPSNLTANITYSEGAVLTDPKAMPTDWTTTHRLKITNQTHSDPSKNGLYVWYDLTCRVISPIALPVSDVLFSSKTDSPLLSSWTKDTKGWASAGCEENASVAKFSSNNRGFYLAFSDVPEKVNYTIFFASAAPAGNEAKTTKFTIEESIDGEIWEIAREYIGYGNEPTQISLSNATLAEKMRSCNLKSTTRFVRFLLVTKDGRPNITLQDLTISKGSTSINAPELLDAKAYIENNELIISSDENIAKIQIYNNGGQLLKEANTVSRVNLSDLASGSLFVKVLGENGKSNSFHLAK